MNKTTVTECRFAVISACSYLWLGAESILRQQRGLPVRIDLGAVDNCHTQHRSDSVPEGVKLLVFLTRDICALLTIIKKLVSLLNTLSKGSCVTLFSQLPPGWLYANLCSLVKNRDVVQRIHLCRALPSAGNLAQAHFPLLECVIKAGEGGGIAVGAGLSACELDAVFNYYQGKSVRSLSLCSGVSEKTIYTHRHCGLKKLTGIQQWLNDAVLKREQNRCRYYTRADYRPYADAKDGELT